MIDYMGFESRMLCLCNVSMWMLVFIWSSIWIRVMIGVLHRSMMVSEGIDDI